MEGGGAVMDAGYVQRLRKAIRLSCKGQEPQQREANTATVKAMVRSMPDGGPEEAAAAILLHLQGTSCEERQHALVLTDVLFKRSQAFRGKIISTMDSVLAFSTGCRPGYPLPGPPEASRQLKALAFRVIDSWNREFGGKSKQMEIAYKFAKSRLGITGETLAEGRLRGQRVAQGQRRGAGGEGGASAGGSSRSGGGGGGGGGGGAPLRAVTEVEGSHRDRGAHERGDEQDVRMRSRQVSCMVRDAPPFLAEVRRNIDAIEAEIERGTQSGAHSIFSSIFSLPESSENGDDPPSRTDNISAGGGGRLDSGAAAGLGMVGTGYSVTVNLAADPLKGTTVDGEKIKARGDDLKWKQVPMLVLWRDSIGELWSARGDEDGPGEKQLMEEVMGLIERVGRVLEVCGQVTGGSSKRGGRWGGKGEGDGEDDDELEDVELPSGGVLAAAAADDPATFAEAVEDFLSSDEEGGEGLEDVDVGGGGGGGGSKKPRFV